MFYKILFTEQLRTSLMQHLKSSYFPCTTAATTVYSNANTANDDTTNADMAKAGTAAHAWDTNCWPAFTAPTAALWNSYFWLWFPSLEQFQSVNTTAARLKYWQGMW